MLLVLIEMANVLVGAYDLVEKSKEEDNRQSEIQPR
jgi:hypothetical protein